MRKILCGALIAAIALSVIPIAAPSALANGDDGQIEALKNQINEIQNQNNRQIEELKKRIQELEAKGETPAAPKAEADKDAWHKKFEGGYKDGLYFKSKDGNFSVRTRINTQTQFSVTDTDDNNTTTNFRIRRLRVSWDGNAFRPWFLYTIQIDAIDDIILRDAFFDIALNTLVAPRVGQYKVPFSREQLNSGASLQLIERSILDAEFGFGRDLGAGVYGVLGNYITYGAGVFNGDGRNTQSRDSNLLYAGRVQFTPCCGELKYKQGSFPTGGDYNIEPNFSKKPLLALSVAAAGIPGLNVERKTPEGDIDDRFAEIGAADADVISLTADVNFRYNIFSAEGYYFFRDISPDDGALEEAQDQGFGVAGGVFIIPDFVEIAGRFAYIDYDDDIDGRDSKLEITPGVNVYLSRSHKWKLQFGYSFIRDEDTNGEQVDQNIFRTQLQAAF